ncbi:MAG: D-alanyl-D-alanine carboxypeptidase family protein [Clostridia bacterium]|nr:D-alanyl-D-alanine carboxypeptidase family protein [Clostridia bacterium]
MATKKKKKQSKKKAGNSGNIAWVVFAVAALAIVAAALIFNACSEPVAPVDTSVESSVSECEDGPSDEPCTEPSFDPSDNPIEDPLDVPAEEESDEVSDGPVGEPSPEPSEEQSGDTDRETSNQQESEAPEASDLPDETAESTKAYEEYVGVKYAIDMTQYERCVCPDDEEKYVFLVNADHPLAEDFVPADLVKCTSMRKGRPDYYSYMDRVANKALEAFLKEAAYYGYGDITVTNAYRSYSVQRDLFNYYLNRERQRYATEEEAIAAVLTYSTRPGTSEHQSGLACDMHNKEKARQFNGTPAARWLEENACRFGFILRYPEGTQHITGIIYESWHFRFVGRTAATEIHNLGVTLDEYLEPERFSETSETSERFESEPDGDESGNGHASEPVSEDGQNEEESFSAPQESDGPDYSAEDGEISEDLPIDGPPPDEQSE